MRIAIGQLCQESNTFNPLPTTRADFDVFGIYRGDELVERMAQTNEPGGFIQALRDWPERPEIVGLMRFWAWPSGPLTAATFAALLREMSDALAQAGNVDAILLSLHGALIAANEPDVSGRFLDALRRMIGPAIPLVATLDLHANVTARMVRAADALVLYHTTPHIDVVPTGVRAAGVLRRILVDGVRPVTAFQKLPMVSPVERANTQDPASISFGLRETLQAWEADPRVLTAGLATVQPWLDIPDLGNAVVVTTAGDEDLARSRCAELAGAVWQRRHEYMPEIADVADTVRQTHAENAGLVVLGDAADATTSGSTGDGTTVLAELIHYDWPRPALATLVGPEVVAEAQRRGVGAEWTATLGGTRTALRSAVDAGGARRDAIRRPLHHDRPSRRQPANRHGPGHGVAARQRPRRGNVTLGPPLFAAAFPDGRAGPVRRERAGRRSPCGFRAAYADRARRIVMVRTPGCAPSDFWNHPYEQISRPLWPWDEIATWSPQPQVACG